MENFGVSAYLKLHRSAYNKVALLTDMGRKLNIAVKRFLAENTFNVKRLGNPVPERGGKVVIVHAVGALNALSVVFASDCVRLELGRRALNNFRNVNTECKRTTINKRKAEIMTSVFTLDVFLNGNIGKHCHFFN